MEERNTPGTRRSPCARPSVAALAGVLLLALAPPPAARAQEELEDVFGELGTAATVEEGEADAAAPGEGTIAGRVFDGDTGLPIPGVTVIAIFPEPPGGGERPQEVAVTGADGGYEFPSVPPGTYDLSFVKAGYRAATMTRFEVLADQVNTGDFPMPPLPPGTSDEVLELDPFVAEASAVGEMMSDLELRMDADQMLNVMSAEELARFAAGDVAEALKRVAGVNVVEGKFAIIRGLEDRYSSTLYNAAPIPSPDPDRQSPQLDLFPSEVVSNLVVSKTFASEHPGNSSSGSIDIVTHDYPEAPLDLKVKSGTGFNDNASDEYLEYRDGSPIGTRKDAASGWPDDTLESEFGGSLGGRQRFFGREFRFKGVLNREIDYVTKDGYKNNREPRPTEFRRGEVTVPGGLSLGKLDLMGGRFDLTESSREEQNTGFGAFGFDFDPNGDHAIDASFFYTDKKEETVELQSNGYFPNFDYSTLRELEIDGEEIRSPFFNDFATATAWIRNVRTDPNFGADRGPLWFTSFFESKSFQTKRDLKVWQANGQHRIALLDGLQLSWAANHAKTTQKDLTLGVRYFFEPTSERLGEILADPENELPTVFPVQPQDLGPGRFATNGGIIRSANDIDENQDFGRIDARYEREFLDWLSLEVHGGGWYENSNRDVESSFLESTSVGGLSQYAVFGDTPEQLGDVLIETLDKGEDGRPTPTRDMLNDSKREITAWNFGAKATLWDKLDLLGGLRTEKIEISSNNDAFTGEDRFGAPDTYPTRYLFFDRRDNPTRTELRRPRPPGTGFNDELLGIDVPIDTSTTACDPPGESRGCVDLLDRAAVERLINGKIDETEYLPTFGFAYRPIEGLALRGAYSETVARPSFREIGFYVTVEPGTEDLIIGNPQLKLSEVDSYDLRAEYTWGEYGDLFGVSGFYKEIEDPIESIVVRDPLNAEKSSSSLFRTFFNNPNEAELWGVEVELRKNLGFLATDYLEDKLGFSLRGFLSRVSIGGNFTYIDAEVERSAAELGRSTSFFGVPEGEQKKFGKLDKKRRLFGQPEWIGNADISFDHPDWGTKVTLAYFTISDVLDAAGSAFVGTGGRGEDFTLDRYIDSYYTLDLIASQALPLPRNLGRVAFKFSAKNLTNSTRDVKYDSKQTSGDVKERSFKEGRDYSFSLTWSFDFDF